MNWVHIGKSQRKGFPLNPPSTFQHHDVSPSVKAPDHPEKTFAAHTTGTSSASQPLDLSSSTTLKFLTKCGRVNAKLMLWLILHKPEYIAVCTLCSKAAKLVNVLLCAKKKILRYYSDQFILILYPPIVLPAETFGVPLLVRLWDSDVISRK